MTTRDASGWVGRNALAIAILVFQLIQFGLGNSFEVKAHAKEIADLKVKVDQVETGCEKKETLAVKLDALKAEIAGLREQLRRHDDETRRQPR